MALAKKIVDGEFKIALRIDEGMEIDSHVVFWSLGLFFNIGEIRFL